METYNITHKDKKTNARIGIINTKSGPIETPFFMPIATRGAIKYIKTEEINKIGARAIISNALILSLNSGLNILKNFGGIKEFMKFKGINVTDSGGFQMYSPSIYLKSDDKGVLFRNPITGEKIFMTPEDNMKLQYEINSDIAMCLDSMPMYEHSKKDIEEAVRKTSLWAKRGKKSHDKLNKKLFRKKQLLFGIIQGGTYEDLRERSSKDLIKLNFDGYSIGGFGLGETISEEMKIVSFVKNIIPENKPVYLMGIGSPIEILEGISRGVDMFDSRLPTQNARRGSLFTSKGKMRILSKKYEFDKSPIDKQCDCYVCKNYSKAYIRYLLKNDEPVGKELASHHNLYFLQKLIEKAKEEIKKGTFEKFKDKIKRIYKENL